MLPRSIRRGWPRANVESTEVAWVEGQAATAIAAGMPESVLALGEPISCNYAPSIPVHYDLLDAKMIGEGDLVHSTNVQRETRSDHSAARFQQSRHAPPTCNFHGRLESGC